LVPKPVEIECCFYFPQTVIDAEKPAGPKATEHQLSLGSTCLVTTALKKHPYVSFNSRAQRPRLIRRLNRQSTAWPVGKRRHGFGRRSGVLLKFNLLGFEFVEFLF